MTHSYVWRDSFVCVTWLFRMRDMTHPYVDQAEDSVSTILRNHGKSWLIPMCDMTHSYVWHDSFICVTWRIHMCDMTHSYVDKAEDSISTEFFCETMVSHDSFLRLTWRIHMCDMTHSYVWHDAFIYVTWRRLTTYEGVCVCVCVCHMSHTTCESYLTTYE